MANLPNDSGQARPYITHPCLLGRSPYCGGVGTWEGDCRRSEHGEAEITSDEASQPYPLTFPYEQRYGKCFSELNDPGLSDSNRSGVTARLSAPSARQGRDSLPQMFLTNALSFTLPLRSLLGELSCLKLPRQAAVCLIRRAFPSSSGDTPMDQVQPQE